MKKQKSKLTVRLDHSFNSFEFENWPQDTFTLEIESVTEEDMHDIETIFAALNWVELRQLAERARMLLGRKDRLLKTARTK